MSQEKPPVFLLISDDAIGGFFIPNGGGLGMDIGKVYYFSPDNLEYEPLKLSYSEFLNFCFNRKLKKFYKGYIQKNWRKDVQNLEENSVFTFYPCLWSKEGKNIEKRSKQYTN